MSTASPSARNLARRLIALEAARPASPVACGSEAARVVDKLRVPLARLAGVAGFRSLMSRALALAKAEAPSLNKVSVQPDGSLQGFDESGPHDADTAVVVVSHLLGLLVTFIGEPLTLGFVRDAWPDAAGEDAGSEEPL